MKIYNLLLLLALFVSVSVSSYAADSKAAKYKTVQIGDELKMICNNLNDIAKVQWYKDGVKIIGETGEKLIFRNANLSHEGTYWAVVDGVCGITRTNDMVVQVEIPFQPGIETAVAGGDFLFQNEPNPAGEIIRIKFNLSTATNARLVLSDTYGKVIAVLHDGFAGTGFHTFELNASEKNLSNGAYFYTLITPDFTSTKTMILMR
jgi:hypothetical protein